MMHRGGDRRIGGAAEGDFSPGGIGSSQCRPHYGRREIGIPTIWTYRERERPKLYPRQKCLTFIVSFACSLLLIHAAFSISRPTLYSLALSAFKARLMMMSAPFYKVSILTFSPCGGFFPHPTTDCEETATTDRE